MKLGPRPWTYHNAQKDHLGLQEQFKWDFAGSPCWLCGVLPETGCGHDLHHLFAGYSRGRSHQRFLFTWACRDCHTQRVGTAWLGVWLYLKWFHDPMGTDWERMARRHGGTLPDLIEWSPPGPGEEILDPY